MIGKAIDNLIGIFNPSWAARRMHQRQVLRVVAANGRHKSMEKLLGDNTSGGYEAGKTNRLTGRRRVGGRENNLPRAQLTNIAWRSWDLYRNNPQARKICTSLKAKVIGRGPKPQSQATTKDGKPHLAFRKRAQQIWQRVGKQIDYRGRPGRGGQTLTGLHKTALQAAVLSGGTLLRFRRLSAAQQKDLGLLLPLQVQLIHVSRLDERIQKPNVFNGVETDKDDRIVAYHIKNENRDGTQTVGDEQSTRIPAKDVVTLFVEEDIDQILGTPWLASTLLTADDRRDYEYYEILAAQGAACYVAGYKRSSGQSYGPALPNPDDPESAAPLTDADGNTVSQIQPQMLIDLGTDGEMNFFAPNRPNQGAPEFINHLLRAEAVSVPGVKSSTLTGDYRKSSFSSERSADNDAWPELEQLQDWLHDNFTQPIYEAVITAAVEAGLFEGVKDFDVEDFNERKAEYLETHWQGPVARSIKPSEDAIASRERIRGGTSSPQIEAAMQGRNWIEILDQIEEFIEEAVARNVPRDVIMQILGIEQRDTAKSRDEERDLLEEEEDTVLEPA